MTTIERGSLRPCSACAHLSGPAASVLFLAAKEFEYRIGTTSASAGSALARRGRRQNCVFMFRS